MGKTLDGLDGIAETEKLDITPRRFLNLVKKLVELEESQYANAKEAVRSRNELRKGIKAYLAKQAQLPPDSQFYAGLQSTKGRISWKGVAEELVRKCSVQEEQYQKIQERYRSESQRLKYGRIEDASTPKFQQLEFDFVTPKELV